MLMKGRGNSEIESSYFDFLSVVLAFCAGSPFSPGATGNAFTQEINLIPSDLTPSAAAKTAGSTHSVTVTVGEPGNRRVGISVGFSVQSGPNAGRNSAAVTDSNGQAVFSYTSNGQPGTDRIKAAGSVARAPFISFAEVTWNGNGGGGAASCLSSSRAQPAAPPELPPHLCVL